MKHFLIVAFFIAFSFISEAQHKSSLEVGYTRNYMSNSINLLYHQPFAKRSAYYFGLKVHKNNNNFIAHDASGRMFYQLGYAENFLQSLGLNLGYNYRIFKSSDRNFIPYLFYDAEIARLKLKNNFIAPVAHDTLGYEYFSFDRSISMRPIVSLHNNIGLGSSFKISPQYYFNFQVGVGIFVAFTGRNLYFSSVGSNRIYLIPDNVNTEIIGVEGMPFVRLTIGRFNYKQ